MPKARHTQVTLEATPYYHCVKLYELTKVFALDLCAYAVMSNHYHVVLYVDAAQAESWSQDAVISRWYQLVHAGAE